MLEAEKTPSSVSFFPAGAVSRAEFIQESRPIGRFFLTHMRDLSTVQRPGADRFPREGPQGPVRQEDRKTGELERTGVRPRRGQSKGARS